MVDEFAFLGSDPRRVEKLIIACPDGRGNLRVDEENTGDAIVISSPGASVSSHHIKSAIIKMLNEHEITQIVLMPHMDCYLTEQVDRALHLGKSIDPQTFSLFVEPFKQNNITFHNREHLEGTVNPALQKLELKQIVREWQSESNEGAREIKVSSNLWDPRRDGDAVNKRRILLVTAPSRWHYEHLIGKVSEAMGIPMPILDTLVLQPPDINSIRFLMTNLGIRDVVLYAAGAGEREEIKKLERDLKDKDFVVNNRTLLYTLVPKAQRAMHHS